MSEASDVVDRNVHRVLTDEGPPRLRYDMETAVIGKDTKRRMVLLVGFGPFGTGRMWCRMGEEDEKKPGWNDAPEVDWKTSKLMDGGEWIKWMNERKARGKP